MPDPLIIAAAMHRQQGGPAAAEIRYTTALRGGGLSPEDEALAWINLSVIHSEREQLAMAEACARKAHNMTPQDGGALTNLGNYLFRQGHHVEGMEHLRRAIELDPDGVSTHANLALALYDLAEYAECIAEMETAITHCSGEGGMHLAAQLSFDLGRAVLATGDWRRGWMLYEQRWGRLPRTHIWDLGIPEWDGDAPLDGKTILVHQDQGFGDTLQFARLVLRLVEMGAQPVFAVPRHLVRVLSQIAPTADIVDMARGDGFDFHIAVCSLPYRLRLTSPDELLAVPYLRAQGTPRQRQNFNVMLFWAADTSRGTGASRSVPLAKLLPLAGIPGVRLYSAQMPPHAGEIGQIGAAVAVEDLSPHIRDFADTAAFMANMDLVICVDTAPLHLAGAMGVPVIALLPATGRCWRWGCGEKTTPWYPSMRLMWADKPGEWPWAELHGCLEALARGESQDWPRDYGPRKVSDHRAAIEKAFAESQGIYGEFKYEAAE